MKKLYKKVRVSKSGAELSQGSFIVYVNYGIYFWKIYDMFQIIELNNTNIITEDIVINIKQLAKY